MKAASCPSFFTIQSCQSFSKIGAGGATFGADGTAPCNTLPVPSSRAPASIAGSVPSGPENPTRSQYTLASAFSSWYTYFPRGSRSGVSRILISRWMWSGMMAKHSIGAMPRHFPAKSRIVRVKGTESCVASR